MSQIPEPIAPSIADLIDQAHQERPEKPRQHLGASMLGHSCDRWLWLSFRWAVREEFSGRMLRLFRRGHNEEATVISDLRAIGVDVSDTQSRVDFGAHVSGSTDGVAKFVPGSEKTPHVLEIKTHSKKSFDDLEKHGVMKSKPVHYAQMQVYMLGLKLERALYYAVCKDDDRIYTERVKLDKGIAQKLVERGRRITLSDRMPPPLSTDPTWYECRFCPAHGFCHKKELPKTFSCRTCAHSTAKEDSTWRCEKHEADGIPVEFQVKGCESGVIHPDIVPHWTYTPDDRFGVVWHTEHGDIANGDPDANIYSSAEILANPQACAKGLAEDFRKTFDARVVG